MGITEPEGKRIVNLEGTAMKTREFNPRWSACFVSAPLVVLVCLGGLTPAAQDDLLHSLIKKNEAAGKKIQALQSIQYTLERDWLARGQQQPFHGVAQVKKKGNCSWVTYRRTGINFTAGEIQEIERRAVINDKYAAEWPAVGNPLAYRWDHESVDAMGPETKTHLAMTGAEDFLCICFGHESTRFSEALKIYVDRIRYEAVERKGEDGRFLYDIQCFNPKDLATPNLVWTIDPQKGFLATEVVLYESEKPQIHDTMRVEEIAPGVWCPVGHEETRYAKTKEGEKTPSVESWCKVRIKDLKINEPIPDEQFDF
jgi:hypothetical protein